MTPRIGDTVMMSTEQIAASTSAPWVLMTLGLIAVGICLMLNPRRVPESLCALLILLTPLMYNVFMPRSVLGVRGLTLGNLLFMIAFLLLFIRIAGTGRVFGLIRVFLSVPLLLMMAAYTFGVGITFFADEQHPYYASGGTMTDLIMLEMLKPMQMMIIGWLAMLVCFMRGGKQYIQRVLLLGPVVLFPVVVAFTAMGGEGDLYAGRDALSWNLRLHANQVGAIGVYFLVLALMMREHAWPLVRSLAIFCSLGLVALSFSRIAFLSTIIMLGLLFFKINRTERRILIVGLFVTVLTFAGDWAYRLQSGIELDNTQGVVAVRQLGAEGVDLNEVSAGRIEDIWLPALAMIEQKPWTGYGVGTPVVTPRYGFIVAHNAYITVLLELGIIGALALANLLFFAFKDAFARNSDLFYVLVALCLLTLTGHQFYPYHSTHILWVVYGMALAERYGYAFRQRADESTQAAAAAYGHPASSA